MELILNKPATFIGHHPTEAVFNFLASEIKESGCWESIDGMLKLTLPRPCLENRLGILLQQIQYVIDRQYPQRTTDIPLIVTDDEGKYLLHFKIWHTA